MKIAIKHKMRKILYKWNYAKIVWITKDHPSGRICPEKYPLAKPATVYIAYGDPGWLWAWIAFNLFLPKQWFGRSCSSWTKIRNIKSSSHNTNINYENPNEYGIPKIHGWNAAVDMFCNRKK